MNERAKQAMLALAKDDRLTPDQVVKAAKASHSPLHPYFTWDDRRAAAQQRLHEARRLIASFEYVVTTTPFVVKVPMFVRDPSAAPEQGYISIARLRTEKELARDALLAEFDRALGALRRAKEIAFALGMTAEIEKLHWQVEQLSGRVQQVAA